MREVEKSDATDLSLIILLVWCVIASVSPSTNLEMKIKLLELYTHFAWSDCIFWSRAYIKCDGNVGLKYGPYVSG